MAILAIDQSYTSSGIVVLEGNKILYAERFVSNTELDIYERAWEVADRSIAVAKKFKVEYIAVEGLAFSKFGDATRDLAGLQYTMVTRLRFVEGYDVIIVPPNTVKKVATGKGNAKKEELMESLPKRVRAKFDKLGVKKTTGLLDLTDAFWIGKAAQIQRETDLKTRDSK